MNKLKPCFKFYNCRRSMLIHKSEAEICINNNTYSGECDVRLEFVPSARIRIYGYFRDVQVDDARECFFDQAQISSFSINKKQIDGLKASCNGDERLKTLDITWIPRSEPINIVGNDSIQMKYLIFHIFNFDGIKFGMRNSAERYKKRMHAVFHIDLNNGDWDIEIKSLASTDDTLNHLSEKGGYALTHLGGIKKNNEELFRGDDARECLRVMRYFLSFAKGGWCGPVCAVGFGESGERIWESWTSPNESWTSYFSWYDYKKGPQLAQLFPGFMERWKDDEWQRTLCEVIYWYINANKTFRGIDAGIILAQAAIERLSFEYVVMDKRLLEAKGFKELRASDKFRLLFSSLKIPLDLGSFTPLLESHGKRCKWLDAPHALTEIRNSIVHPEHKRKGQLNKVHYEAWRLTSSCCG